MPLTTDLQTPPKVKGWLPKQYLLISIIAPLALFFVLIGAVELAAKQQQLREQSRLQEELSSKASEIRTLLEYELNSMLHIATGLVSYIQSKQGAAIPEEIAPWLANLGEGTQHIRNIAIAPNNKVTQVYPLAGNEAVLGLNYPDNKEQWPGVQKIIASKRPLLAGPIHLQQGGLGLIYRIPVFLDNKSYWGLVSTVLNFDEIYYVIHTRAEQLGIKIAIKDRDNAGKIIFGDKDVIANHELNLSITGRNWQMIASHHAPGSYKGLNIIRFSGWLITFVISLLFNSFLRSLAQQNQTLHELNESKYRFSQAFNTAPQGIALIAHSGMLIDFNQSLCATLGYTHDELQGQSFFTIVVPNQRERLSNIIEGIYPKPGANHQYESALVHKSEQQINVLISMAPTHANIYESDWIVQILDINHRIAFEQLLQEEASYNQSILHAVTDGIIILDTNGNIRSANPAAGNIFGYPLDRFARQHINQFLHDPKAGGIMSHIKFHSEKRNINADINHNIIGVKMNGQHFSLDLQLSCVQHKHEKLFIAVVRDISERKRLEDLKHEFISTISHELRTPLTAILASLRLIEGGALGSFSEPVQKVIRIADQNGQKLSLLIDDLLDMDKLLAGKMQFNFLAQPIYPLVLASVENITPYAEQHHVQLALVSPDEQLHVNVDGNRLQQVLTNLLSNATKFSPAQSMVNVHIIKHNNSVRVEITDTGMGIAPEAQVNLFQRFYQVDQPTMSNAGGTGLGLAISKELITTMHGSIGVNSEVGKGSCFFVELPLIANTKNLE